MNPLAPAALVAVLAAGALACAVMALRPQRHRLADVRAALHGDVAPTNRTGVRSALTRRVSTHFGEGLATIDLRADDIAARVFVAGAVGGFGTLLLVCAAAAAGSLPAMPLWFVASPLVGGVAGWIMWNDVTGRIETRRRDLRRATTDFVQLVAVGLTTDQSVEQAVGFALQVGDGDALHLLRTELETAPLRGIPLWEALDQLGRRFGQRELSEFAASIERQGTHGVSITDTVNTLATSMRERALDELEREADAANANLAGPTICFVITTIVFLAYPLALRISEAFGG
jgi:Flp pilus assembly protein TadB